MGMPVHIEIALIADDHPSLGVKHHEALGHVGECRVEQQVLIEQLLLARLQIGRTIRDGFLDHVFDLIELLGRE